MAMQVLLIGARAALYYCSPFTGKLDNFFKTRRRGESDASARYSAVLPNDTTEQHRAEGDGGSESSGIILSDTPFQWVLHDSEIFVLVH